METEDRSSGGPASTAAGVSRQLMFASPSPAKLCSRLAIHCDAEVSGSGDEPAAPAAAAPSDDEALARLLQQQERIQFLLQ